MIPALTAFTGGLSSQTVLIGEPSVTLPSHLRLGAWHRTWPGGHVILQARCVLRQVL
jgi:hypothetical protein